MGKSPFFSTTHVYCILIVVLGGIERREIRASNENMFIPLEMISLGEICLEMVTSQPPSRAY